MSRSCGASIWTGQLFLFYLTLTAMTSIACTDDGNSQSANRFKPGWCSSVRRRWTHCCVLDYTVNSGDRYSWMRLLTNDPCCRLRSPGDGRQTLMQHGSHRATAVNGCIVPRSIRRPSVWRPLRCYMASSPASHPHASHAAYGRQVSSCPVRAQRNPRELCCGRPAATGDAQGHASGGLRTTRCPTGWCTRRPRLTAEQSIAVSSRHAAAAAILQQQQQRHQQ
jgi:hypothetical protein